MNLINPIAKGNTAEIYLSDGKILKVFTSRLPDGEAEYEANKQKLAHSCGLPVPQVFDVTRINGKQAIIMEYVKGTTIGDLMQNDEGNVESYLSLSVDIQVDMHSKSITSLESMKDKLARQLREASILNDTNKAILLERLAELPLENKLCHGDYHVFNLIKSANKTVIIDWVDSSAGNPCADIYRTFLLYSQFSTRWADVYLDLYCSKSTLSRDDIFAWAPIVAGARLSENVSTENANRLLEIVRKYL